MPDTDTDTDETEHSVDSDASIYARVTDDGVDPTASERPDLPAIHGDLATRSSGTNDLPGIVANGPNQWVVGRTRNDGTGHCYETWTPLEEPVVGPNSGGNRLHLQGDRIQNGHSNPNPHLDELFVVHRTRIEETYQNAANVQGRRITTGTSALELNGQQPARSPYEQSLGWNYEWLHATDPTAGYSWEAFVPMEQARFGVENGCILLEWDDEMILRTRHRNQHAVIDQQNGLRLKNIFTVPESRVPMRPESGTVVGHDAVEQYVEHADMLGSTRDE